MAKAHATWRVLSHGPIEKLGVAAAPDRGLHLTIEADAAATLARVAQGV